MTNLRWLKWAITRHFRQKGLKVHLASIRLGNVAIDGEVEGKGWKMALELKTPGDDITRGIGQLAEALAYGYNQVALVTTLRTAKRVDPAVFDRLGLVLLGIDSKGIRATPLANLSEKATYWTTVNSQTNCILAQREPVVG